MNTTVTIHPPGEPTIELNVNGVKNLDCLKGSGFVASLTVSELRSLWTTITAKLKEYSISVTTEPLP